MVLLTITPKILTALTGIPSSKNDALELPDTLELGAPISHSTLISLSRILKQQQKKRRNSSSDHAVSEDFSLNTLLHSTSVYIPPPPPKPTPSPEYVALMAELKRQQEQREYYSLTSKEEAYQDQLDGTEGQKDDISPSLVLNILLSVVLCAVVGFHLSHHVFPHNDGMRVLCALGTGIVVGVAEVGVYAAYLRKVSEAQTKEKSKKEVKVSLGEYKPPSPDVDENVVVEEKDSEEIWGRGIHGGVRRRVRDKWQKENESGRTKIGHQEESQEPQTIANRTKKKT